MEILLLGTGAADGWPNPFCECASCRAVRAAGPSATRAQSSALVDGSVLLDMGGDVAHAAARHGVSLASVTVVLVTHGHPDHVAPELLLWRHWAGARERLRVVGPAAALALLDDWIAPDADVDPLPVSAGDTLDLDGYRIRVLAANHGDEAIGPGVLYDVTGPDGGRLLYATDTGPLPVTTLAAVEGASYDVVLLEESWGDRADHGTDHLDLRTFAEAVAELRRRGAVHQGTTVAPIHLGHHNPPPAELEARLAEWDVRLLPDGARLVTGGSPRPPRRAGRTLLVGGARSGKSRAAEQLLAAEPAITYVATSPVATADAEWTERVGAHQARRPTSWQTVETTDLAKLLDAHSPDAAPLLVDCLTLWLAAVMDDAGCWETDGDSPEVDADLAGRVAALVAAWRACRGRVVGVTNEVGQGVVPATPAGRRFRDEMGRLNAAIAAESDDVWLVTAGLRQRLR
ncbi:MAG TPA: bifunctional adenosylcobinamide kinase/adenosylcobinamide-phosphate guanylyltransferase [Mycobacteriales bacterium]|nr:bifunctional adenosylcobinamide kinase/adenosylcobinamide-phosphate guanylyltransferase [Mycobacteriales bacterium]